MGGDGERKLWAATGAQHSCEYRVTSCHVASLRAGLTLMINWAGRHGCNECTTAVICPDGRRHTHLLSVWSCCGAAVNQ